MSNPLFEFSSKIWLWSNGVSPASWHFVTLPKDLGSDVKELFGDNAKGFGSLKVSATIGNTTWQTSIFPSKEEASYLLPIKAQVRKAEKIAQDDKVKVTLEILVDE